jgi:hypothetical protein
MKMCKLCKNAYSMPYGFTDKNLCSTCYDLRQAQGLDQ